MTSINGYFRKFVFLTALISLPLVSSYAYADHGGGHGGGGGGMRGGGGGNWHGGGGNWHGGGGGGHWHGGGDWDRGDGWGGGVIIAPGFYGGYGYPGYYYGNPDYYDSSPYYDDGSSGGVYFDDGGY